MYRFRRSGPALAPACARGRAACSGGDETDDVLYDDGRVRLDREALTLRRYYFPLGTSKRIPYTDIRGVELRPLTWLTGKGRLWPATPASAGSGRPARFARLRTAHHVSADYSGATSRMVGK